MASDNELVVRGAREHNLRDLTVRIPKNRFVVVSGPSGSGKSTLVFDTIYAEAAHRFLESLSLSARQFIAQLKRPDVDSIKGLSPAIAIAERGEAPSARATVSDLTEISPHLRLLFSKIGVPWCEVHGRAIVQHPPERIVSQILAFPEGTKVQLLAPVRRDEPGNHRAVLSELRGQGYVRLRVDGEFYTTEEDINLEESASHDIDVVMDRIVVREGIRTRVTDSVEGCLALGRGFIRVLTAGADGEDEALYCDHFSCPECDTVFPVLTPQLFSPYSPRGACTACNGRGSIVNKKKGESLCRECLGAGLNREARSVQIGGKNLAETEAMDIVSASQFFSALKVEPYFLPVVKPIVDEIQSRLSFLAATGLDYLSLNRRANTIAGGERQRIRLAGELGGALTGVLYVLDEPSVGLHPQDIQRLLHTISRLRDEGNSVLVVDHDREVISQADWVLDLGPGAGVKGGRVVAEGEPSALAGEEGSPTGQYLAGKFSVYTPEKRRTPDGRVLRVVGASLHNLKQVTVSFPVGLFVCVTGVSGSGKSSLIEGALVPGVRLAIGEEGAAVPLQYEKLEGASYFERVLAVDQSPLGRSPRSNAATFTGLFDVIRELYGALPGARVRGYTRSRFSFNVKGGRCAHCEGAGVTRVAMHFLPDVFVECVECRGARYNPETLEVRFKGYSISQLLDMSVDRVSELLKNVPKAFSKLQALREVGLGYLPIGQPATTLSGGEAQRVKLAKELGKRTQASTLYVFDEPTTGLHAVDTDQLLRVMHRLVDNGHTVVAVEHSVDVIRSADWVIDLGPGGGDAGGELVAEGTPEEIKGCARSVTGQYL